MGKNFLASIPLPSPFKSFHTQSQDYKTQVIREQLTATLLREVREFWFGHISEPGSLVIPGSEERKRWFFGGHDFDNACMGRFAPTLEAIRKCDTIAGADILAAIQLVDPFDWLSLVLLFDQIPRNCYRGSSASIVFNFFDPIARHIAIAAIEKGIPNKESLIRWQFAYRTWFYMPLMHSEELADHQLAVKQFDLMLQDIKLLVQENTTLSQGDEYLDRARRIVRADVDAAWALGNINMDFEKKHQVIIARFGRYPHRNEALGRVSTADELQYLASGGETFSSQQKL